VVCDTGDADGDGEPADDGNGERTFGHWLQVMISFLAIPLVAPCCLLYHN